MSVNASNPLNVLRVGVDSFRSLIRDDGELIDPVYKEPAQYGTPYHGFCHAAIASLSTGPERLERARLALKVCSAALAHVEDPACSPNLSGANRATGAGSAINHRDFFWPAILKSYILLRDILGGEEVAGLKARIGRVDVPKPFMARPPSNWASVWLSGEWIRIREGLSNVNIEQFDEWLGVFFDGHIDIETGFFHEGGHPNSYDLFTRFHLQDLLAEGYDGRWRATLEKLLISGLRRSLAVQLSDGSMASAYRSTGQTWTLGVQCAYFTEAAEFLAERDPQSAARARNAAGAAFESLARYQRRDGYFSPVENLLPPEMRVGYEGYSFDGNYANLALGFFAVALLRGFDTSSRPYEPVMLAHPEPLTYIENDPVFRAAAHSGPYSVHFNGFPSPAYDSYGIIDVTVGLRRRLQFASSARYLSDGQLYNMGVARRSGPGRGDISPYDWEPLALIGAIEPLPDRAGFSVAARVRGSIVCCRIIVEIDHDGIHISFMSKGDNGYKTVIVPYLRDCGDGHTTSVELTQSASEAVATLSMADEQVRVIVDGPVSGMLDIPYNFENRRGHCGLLRFDLERPTDKVSYRIAAR
ncbi:MAG: hypothetical protein P4L33_11540 [Capsulimonadaceae bacterium]|nr:hypothetical protein [Capsulimonadaceae bacterium]